MSPHTLSTRSRLREDARICTFQENCGEKTNGCFGRSIIIKEWLDYMCFTDLIYEVCP